MSKPCVTASDLEGFEDEEADNNIEVINICPKGDEFENDQGNCDDLSVMQQYYAETPSTTRSVHLSQDSSLISSKADDENYKSRESLQFYKLPVSRTVSSLKHDSIPTSHANGPTRNPLPESVFNISNRGSIPICVASRMKLSVSSQPTDLNDNLIGLDRAMQPINHMELGDVQSRMHGLPVGISQGLSHHSKNFFQRPNFHALYNRPLFPTYGYPYYGAPYFPPPLQPPNSVASPMPTLSHKDLHMSSRMPGLVCRVTPPPDVSSDSPVFGIIQHEKQDSNCKVKTYFMCDFCHMKCEDQEIFLNHVLTHMFVCSLCGQQTFSRTQLLNHIAKNHPSHFSKLGNFETMQVARLEVRPSANMVDETAPDRYNTSDADTATHTDEASPEKNLEGQVPHGITVLGDGFVSCEVCKIASKNSDMLLWSAHAHLHQREDSIRIHCLLCGRFASCSEEMLDHFFSAHPDKQVGVALAVQATRHGRLLYVWFCPHCCHYTESIASLSEHLLEKHSNVEPMTSNCLKTALEIDIKESLLERTAGVNKSLDIIVPSLSTWSATDGSAEPDPDSFAHSTSLMMASSPAGETHKQTEANLPNNLAALKTLYDNMVVRTRMITDLIVSARDHYSKSNGVYACRNCVYRTRHKHLVAEHLWNHLPGCKWACHYCTFTNKRRRNVVDHLRNKHKTLSPKLIVQVPTVIDFDNKPMNVQQLNVARKSTTAALKKKICLFNDENSESIPSTTFVHNDIANDPDTGGITLRSVLEASAAKHIEQQPLPKKAKPASSREDISSENTISLTSSTGLQSCYSQENEIAKFSIGDDSLSCWVCNVCHRKDERLSVMRNHLRFAHPNLYSNESLALSHVKKPAFSQETLISEATRKRRMLHPSLLPVEMIFMYPHLLSSNDDRKKNQIGPADYDVEIIDNNVDDVISNRVVDNGAIKLFEISDDSEDESIAKRSADGPGFKSSKKGAVARKSTTGRSLPYSISCTAQSSTVDFLYGCQYCPKEFLNSMIAREHLLKFHDKKQPIVTNLQQKLNPETSKLFLCTSYKCTFSSFSEEKFRLHLIKHSTEENPNANVILVE